MTCPCCGLSFQIHDRQNDYAVCPGCGRLVKIMHRKACSQ